jgi:hypothetical protein
MLKDLTGLEEVDGNYSEDGDSGSLGRLHGSFSILGHIGDVFVRRFASATDPIYQLQYRVINQSGLFAKLNSHKEVGEQTQLQVLSYLSSIPIKAQPGDGATLDTETLQVIKDGFTFINNFYLEFESKRHATPSVLNLLRLNYDHFLDINDDSKIVPLTPALAKSVANSSQYQSILPENIRMLAVELAFI